MTYSIGQAGHVTLGHNELAVTINNELERFGLTRTLNEAHAIGDPSHIDEHHALIDALALLATTAGQTYSTPLPPKRTLGAEHHTDDHNVMAAAAAEARTWDAYNEATGGTVTEYWDATAGKMYRIHTFTADGTLSVTRDVGRPFRVLVVGGGTGAAYWDGTPFPGGEVLDTTTTLAVAGHAVTVGQGGAGGQGSPNAGQPSIIGTVTARPGITTTPVASTITGASVKYGGQGGTDGTYGRGGMGRPGQGESGQPGIVIVSYEVAPWNAATGGTVSDVENYNGTGERWRVHTFTGDGTLDVSIGAQPFRVLAVGGGGGGNHGWSGNTGHGGDGGYGVDNPSVTIAPGTYSVVVGAGGGAAGGYYDSHGGQPSSVAGITGNGANPRVPTNNGGNVTGNTSGANNGPTSNITGTSVTYGRGGVYGTNQAGPPNTGNGGSGGMGDSAGRPGGSGVVIVAYRIG